MNDWYKTAWRRSVVDMHVSDHDERYFRQFDVMHYVDMFRAAKVDSAVVIAQAVTGLCHYPTKYGQMHKGFEGRDVLKESIQLCREHGLKVVVYYGLIFDNWAYENHPEWRIVTADGKELDHAIFPRLKVVCPNNPDYREFVVQRAEELSRNYDFDGIRFDMTLWPHVCYCRHCMEKYERETGEQPPSTVDWLNPRWVRFQRARERWINEFAAMSTATVRAIKPDATVEHQSSTYTFSWIAGITTDFSKSSDLLEGDFYGGHIGGSFACKLYYNLSDRLPFCYETSSGVSLTDHITLKSPELLEAKVSMALANGGAFLFIDSIDPVGTLNPKVYEIMGRIFEKTEVYLPHLGGELCQDVAIYYSTDSKFDFADNGKPVMEASGKSPHVDGAIQTAAALIHHNIPYGVVTRKNLHDLAKYKVLILPNVLMMDEVEAAAIRAYVAGGDKLYASKFTSLTDTEGNRRSSFMLGDVFGIAFLGETEESFTYIAPAVQDESLFGDATEAYPLSIYGTQLKTQATDGAVVLGKTALPFVDPKDKQKYASVLNHPPGRLTDSDAVVLNCYGQGRSLYVAGDMENNAHQEEVFVRFLRYLAGAPFSVESDAPKPVEITTFLQEENNRYIVNLLNFQDQMPNIPVYGIHIKMKTGERRIGRIVQMPEEEALPYTQQEGVLEFVVPKIETFIMIAVEYDA